MAAESTTRLHRLCTELTGRQRGKEKWNHKDITEQQRIIFILNFGVLMQHVCVCFCVCYSVCCDERVHLLSSHQVSHTLQCQVGYAAVILVAAVPKGQLDKETSFCNSKKLHVLSFPHARGWNQMITYGPHLCPHNSRPAVIQNWPEVWIL